MYDSTGRYLDLQGRGEYNAIMELDGKVVVVTGASMGIGEAIAKRFAAEGASVVLLSRDTARAEAARVRIGFSERTVALSCDVRHSEEIDRVLGLTLHHFKRVDVWVNNAGHGLIDSVEQVQMAACRELFETNLFGMLLGHASGRPGHATAGRRAPLSTFPVSPGTFLCRFMPHIAQANLH